MRGFMTQRSNDCATLADSVGRLAVLAQEV
jgi:hypothetical protein